MQTHYSIEMINHKIAFAVYVNDILLSTNQYHQQGCNEFPINQYVYNGLNTLRLNISINPKWFEELKEQKAQVRIIESKGSGGIFKETDVTILKWQWDETVQFPVNLYTNFKIETPYGAWVWLDADIIDENSINFDSLKHYLTDLHSILGNKDYQRLEPLLKSKAIDLANAFYIPHNERLADQENFFKTELFSSETWELEPLNFNELMFDFHANNRLVRILNRNGKSPITSKPIGDNFFELELFLCHKNNQWILCR